MLARSRRPVGGVRRIIGHCARVVGVILCLAPLVWLAFLAVRWTPAPQPIAVSHQSVTPPAPSPPDYNPSMVPRGPSESERLARLRAPEEAAPYLDLPPGAPDADIFAMLFQHALAAGPSGVCVSPNLDRHIFRAQWGEPLSAFDATDGYLWVWQFTTRGDGSPVPLPGPRVYGDHFAALTISLHGQPVRLMAWKAGADPFR